jgi:hypothetical protein
MIRSESAQLAIACFMLEGRVRVPVNQAFTDTIPLPKGKWSLRVDVYLRRNQVYSLCVTTQVRKGDDPGLLLSRKIMTKLALVLWFYSLL